MHDATVRDFEIPAKYGLQSDHRRHDRHRRHLPWAADLPGAGRRSPSDMLEVCPDAWLLNYTNPMAMNVTFLHHVAPKLKVLGLCHSVYWTMVGLCELIDVPFDEVSYWSAGVNHQAWVLRWERDGQDLYPLLDQRIAADPELRRRVRVDMYRRLGYYPTETSEHSSEYVPWYLRHPARSTGCASTSVSTSRSVRPTWPNTPASVRNWPTTESLDDRHGSRPSTRRR